MTPKKSERPRGTLINTRLEPESPDNDDLLREIASVRDEVLVLAKTVGKLTARINELETRFDEFEPEN